MNPYDLYLSKIFAGRTPPESFPWLLVINEVIVGELAFATRNGVMTCCWFRAGPAFSQFAADFVAHAEETRSFTVSAPGAKIYANMIVPDESGFRRDQSLQMRLLKMRCSVVDRLFDKEILRARSLEIADGYALFMDDASAAPIKFPSPISALAERLRPERSKPDTDAWTWEMWLEDDLIGMLELVAIDQPRYDCAFRPASGFERVRHTYERWNELKSAPQSNNGKSDELRELDSKVFSFKYRLVPLSGSARAMTNVMVFVNGASAHFRPTR